MSKKLFSSLLFIGIITQIYSQVNVSSVIGISDNGLANSTNFNIAVSQNLGLEVGMYYNSNDYEFDSKNLEIPIDVFTGQIGVSKKITLLSNRKITTSILGGASIGIEILNKGRSELPNGSILKQKSGYIYGAYVGAQSNIKISSKWDLIARYNSFYHNSDITSHKFLLGLGLGYNF